ncbi:MAG: ABC transporter substrate-binding protein, partial [Phycisphaerales bacterium]|nr:ABC transporter substrate-binding protein [Phycisphaerales bacterium]
GVNEPTGWADLADPRLRSWVGLVNPGQSGSITTAFEAVLLRRGWTDGWRILRRAAANSRSFSASSSKVPIEVSLGDAASGICIDFYGRYQAQAIADAGGGDRVGYMDPPGETRIDADPIAMLRGAPDPELARRFVEFTLTAEGQSLWQLPPRSSAGAGDDDAGPERFALRRMPIRRDIYESPLFARFVDQVQPYAIASRVEVADRNVRSFIAPLFAAMAIDNHDALADAWTAIVTHPAYPPGDGIVTAAMVDDPELRAMLEQFDAMPSVAGPDGAQLELEDTANLGTIRAGWLKSPQPEWADQGLWPEQASPADEMRRGFARFFRARYRQVVDLSRTAG